MNKKIKLLFGIFLKMYTVYFHCKTILFTYFMFDEEINKYYMQTALNKH